jgi:hypothetical protein
MAGNYLKISWIWFKNILKICIKAFSNYDFVKFEAVSDNFSQWDYSTVKQAVK